MFEDIAPLFLNLALALSGREIPGVAASSVVDVKYVRPRIAGDRSTENMYSLERR